MTRPRGRRLQRPSPPGPLPVAALLACLVAGSLFFAFSGGDGAAPGGATPVLSATATLSSRSMLFGDRVEATLDVILPRGTGPGELQAHPVFSPLRIVSRQVDRADLGGGLERISIRYGLTCLSLHCLNAQPITRMRFPATTVSIPGRHVRAVWPPLVQVSRAQGVSAPVTDGLDVGPAVSPHLQPRRDAYEALGAAGVSLVVLLSARLYLRRRAKRRLALTAQPRSHLQALLARVEAGLPEDVLYRQRHALDALAVELRHRRIDGSLAVYAERLAWAPEQPDPAEIRFLCHEIRREAKT
jgi:hypothetical protein